MKLKPMENLLADLAEEIRDTDQQPLLTHNEATKRIAGVLAADRSATIEAAKKIVRKRIRQSQDAITGRMLGDHPTLDPACVPDVVCRDLDSLLDAEAPQARMEASEASRPLPDEE